MTARSNSQLGDSRKLVASIAVWHRAKVQFERHESFHHFILSMVIHKTIDNLALATRSHSLINTRLVMLPKA